MKVLVVLLFCWWCGGGGTVIEDRKRLAGRRSAGLDAGADGSSLSPALQRLLPSLPPPALAGGALDAPLRHQRGAGRPRAELLRAIARRVAVTGVAVVDGIFGSTHAEMCSLEATLLWSLEEGGVELGGWPLVSAPQFGLGAEARALAKQMRGDYVTWEYVWQENLEVGRLVPNLLAHARLVAQLRQALAPHLAEALRPVLNRSVPLAGQSDSMLSTFPGDGAQYRPHVDVSRKTGEDVAGRVAVLSLVYYINAGWNVSAHGGALRVRRVDTGTTVDVAPVADRLAVMLSERTTHQVMPVWTRRRHAISNWWQERPGEFRSSKSRPRQPGCPRGLHDGHGGDGTPSGAGSSGWYPTSQTEVSLTCHG